MAGRDDGIPLREAFLRFRDLVSADMNWADSRKLRFRQKASSAKVAALALTAASTVVLGIPAIPGRAAIALPIVALVTLISALEPFYNWRSRWVLMEETQYRLNRIRDEMDYYLVTTPAADLDHDRLRGFFTDQQDIWQDVSRQWIEFRKHDQIQPGGTPPLDGSSLLPLTLEAAAKGDQDPPIGAAEDLIILHLKSVRSKLSFPAGISPVESTWVACCDWRGCGWLFGYSSCLDAD